MEPSPPLRRWLPLLLPMAAVAVQFAPVLAGRVYRFEDIGGYFAPLWTAAARAMRGGRWPGWPGWPVWDAGAWSGQPLVGDPQLGAFYPPNWLWCLLPALRTYAILAALHALAAAVGMYALARVRGASRAGAALGGVALGVGGYVVLQTRHIMFVEATAWMPWVVAAGLRLCQTGQRRWLAATGLATGLLLCTGGASMIYYGAWFAAAVLLPAALVGRGRAEGGGPRPGAGGGARRLLHLGAAAALGLLLAAPAVVTAAAHAELSPRALGADEAFSGSVAWGGLHFLPSLFIPNLLGQQIRGDYRGGGTQWEIAGYYTGVLTFALGLYALLRGRPERRAERLALGALMLVAVLVAPGAHSPLHHLLARLLPLYGAMRCPPRALYVVALGMPMLAADGLDTLRARLAARPRLARALAAALPLLVAADLLLTHRAENPAMTLAAAEAATHPDVAAALRARLRPGERYLNDVHLDHDLHNSGLLWGLPSAGGYSSLPLWRYLHLLWMANHGRPYPHSRLHDDLSAQGIWRWDSPIVDLLSIRLVLGPAGGPPPRPGFVRRFAGRGGIDVWENPSALPHAWSVPEDQAVCTGGQAQAFVDRWLRTEAWLPPGAPAASAFTRVPIDRPPGAADCPEPPAPPPSPRLPAAAAVTYHGATDLEVAVSPPVPSVLVVGEPLSPGWRATLDGEPTAVVGVYHALVGVRVPAGAHTVRLHMTSRPLELGLGLGALGLLATALLLVSSPRARRPRWPDRRSAPGPTAPGPTAAPPP